MSSTGSKLPNVHGAGGKLAKVAVLGGAAVYAAFNSFYNVEGGHRAIVFNCLEGIKDKVYPEGTHFIIPWFERPIIYDVPARPNLVESTSGSRDLHMTYEFLKNVPFILYWALLVILYEVYAHTANEDDLPHEYKQACFIVLVAVTGVGFFFFFGTQLRGPAGDVGLAVWCFLLLMIMFIGSLGQIVLVCKYPHGKKPAICICTFGPPLLLFIWSFMFEKPECLHKFPGVLKQCCEELLSCIGYEPHPADVNNSQQQARTS